MRTMRIGSSSVDATPPRPKWALMLLVCAAAAGCAGGASPDPDVIARQIPPARTLDADELQAVQSATEEAQAALVAGDLPAARKAADRALRIDPRAPRALAVRALTRRRFAERVWPPDLTEVRTAEGELRRATSLAPTDPFVARAHAAFLRIEGHLTAAAERAEQGLQSAPDDVDLLRVAAGLRHDLGDERQAARLLGRLIAMLPDDGDVAYRLAVAHAAIAASSFGEERRPAWDQAAQRFARYRELRPTDPEGALGEAHARAESYLLAPTGERSVEELDAILAQFAEAARLDPAAARAEYDRGVLLARIGRRTDAIAAFESALAREATHTGALLNLTAELDAEGRKGSAVLIAQRALDHAELTRDERRRLERYVALAESSAAEHGPGR